MSVTLSCTHGDIEIELFWKDAPRTSRNFVELCKAGYYDGITFHKIVPDFMCQSGDPSGNGRGGESIYGSRFPDEMSAKHSHDRKGIVSMANFGHNTNASQFFIIFKPALLGNKMVEATLHITPTHSSHKMGMTVLSYSPHLDGKHTVFGQVHEKSFEVLEKMEKVKIKSYTPAYPVKLFVAEVLEDPWEGQPLPPGAKIPIKPLIGAKGPLACSVQ